MEGFLLSTTTSSTTSNYCSFRLWVPSCSDFRQHRSNISLLPRKPRKKEVLLVYAAASNSNKDEAPELDKWEQMELKFGRLIGEDPKLTLAKIMGLKSNPHLSLLEVEKLYKSKGKAGFSEIVELPFDVSDIRKPSNSKGNSGISEIKEAPRNVSDVRNPSNPTSGLNLGRPVLKKGVKFETNDKPSLRAPSGKRPNQQAASTVENSTQGSPSIILHKPTSFYQDNVVTEKSLGLSEEWDLSVKAGERQSKERPVLKKGVKFETNDKPSLRAPSGKRLNQQAAMTVENSKQSSPSINLCKPTSFYQDNVVTEKSLGLSEEWDLSVKTGERQSKERLSDLIRKPDTYVLKNKEEAIVSSSIKENTSMESGTLTDLLISKIVNLVLSGDQKAEDSTNAIKASNSKEGGKSTSVSLFQKPEIYLIGDQKQEDSVNAVGENYGLEGRTLTGVSLLRNPKVVYADVNGDQKQNDTGGQSLSDSDTSAEMVTVTNISLEPAYADVNGDQKQNDTGGQSLSDSDTSAEMENSKQSSPSINLRKSTSFYQDNVVTEKSLGLSEEWDLWVKTGERQRKERLSDLIRKPTYVLKNKEEAIVSNSIKENTSMESGTLTDLLISKIVNLVLSGDQKAEDSTNAIKASNSKEGGKSTSVSLFQKPEIYLIGDQKQEDSVNAVGENYGLEGRTLTGVSLLRNPKVVYADVNGDQKQNDTGGQSLSDSDTSAEMVTVTNISLEPAYADVNGDQKQNDTGGQSLSDSDTSAEMENSKQSSPSINLRKSTSFYQDNVVTEKSLGLSEEWDLWVKTGERQRKERLSDLIRKPTYVLKNKEEAIVSNSIKENTSMESGTLTDLLISKIVNLVLSGDQKAEDSTNAIKASNSKEGGKSTSVSLFQKPEIYLIGDQKQEDSVNAVGENYGLEGRTLTGVSLLRNPKVVYADVNGDQKQNDTGGQSLSDSDTSAEMVTVANISLEPAYADVNGDQKQNDTGGQSLSDSDTSAEMVTVTNINLEPSLESGYTLLLRDHSPPLLKRPKRIHGSSGNAFEYKTVAAMPPLKECEEIDWGRAEDLLKREGRDDVELIKVGARGFSVAFGYLIGFLPYRNVGARWRFVPFYTWLRRKGLDPSTYEQNLGIVGKYEATSVKSFLDSSVDSKADSKVKTEGKVSPDMKFEDILALYEQEKLKYLSSLVGQKVSVYVVSADRDIRKLIFSAKLRENEDSIAKKKRLMAKLTIGDVVKCCVKKIAYFGILVEVEGVPALIHQSEVSWDATLDPSAYFKCGQIIEAKVMQLDFCLERISLSLKEIVPDPLFETLKYVLRDQPSLDGSLEAEQADTEWIDVESLIKELRQYEGIQIVSKGRYFLSPGLAPTFQVYMASRFEDQYKLLARLGNKVQEVIVETSLSKEELKSAILTCTKRLK